MPSRVVCFVCGSLGGDYGQLHSRPPQVRKGEKIGPDGTRGAYFPFLEHHDPPQGCRQPDADGLVDSCRVCHAFLTQQWANYERSNTPAVKRLYWLKRLDDGQFTGAEMKLQGEYMAQVMGLQYQPTSDAVGGILPQALSPDSRDGCKSELGRDVSRDSGISSQRKKRSIQDHSDHYNEGNGDVLDLSVTIKLEPSLAKQSRKLSTKDSTVEKNCYKQDSVEQKQRDSHLPHTGREHLSQPREPELDEYMYVCYTCGKESAGVAAKFVSSRVHAPGEPYFPFLTRLVPCEGASPMTAQGVCRVCDLCFSSLCHQWLAYEQHGTPSSARIFRLNNLFFSNDASLSMSGAPVGKNQKENNDVNVQKDKEKTVSTEGGTPFKDDDFYQRHGNIQRESFDDTHKSVKEVCYLCSQLWSALEMCPLYTMPASSSREESHSYFPFIRELRRPQGARPLNPDGSVRVCISCNSNLQAQWLQYQSNGTPHSKRRYSLLPTPASSAALLLPSSPLQQSSHMERVRSPEHPPFSKCGVKSECDQKVSPTQPLHLDIGKEEFKGTGSILKYSAPGLNTHHRVSVIPNNQNQQQVSGSMSNTAPSVASSELRHAASATVPLSSTSSSFNTIPHPLQQAGERPKKVCFLCGEKCLSTKSQVLYAFPARHDSKSSMGSMTTAQVSPFFPFISSREPAPNSELMAEDGGIVTCAYCYYSLINQWRDYEEGGKRIQSAEYAGESSGDNRWLRKYSLNEFSCFVCGNVDVPRRSMRTLEVRKYGFLREHRAPPQALVMGGGDSVGCCSFCHYSLTHQLAEYERLGLPPELRKYNWTVQQPGAHHHHLDENSCDTQDSTQESHGPSTGQAGTGSEAEDSNQGPSGASKPLINVPGSAHVEAGKLPPKTATVPPLNHHSSSGNNTTASGSGGSLRTSGFAAALRKLAHQAKDSTDDPSIKQTGSPPDRHSSRDVTSKLRGQGPSQLSFPPWPLSSAPVVTIAPTQTHQAHQHLRSKIHDRGVPQSQSGSNSYEQQHHLHYHQPSHHQDQHQHRPVSPNSKLSSSKEQNHSSHQVSVASHKREEHWSKDGHDSRSSSRVTPQASISSPPNSSNFSLSNPTVSNLPLVNQALPPGHGLTREALDLYARGITAYRPEDEALRLSLASAGLPYGIDPAAYAAYTAAAAAYHPAIMQQRAALAAHSPYRFEDPLLLEHYRLLQASSPYLTFPGLAGLSSLAGLGLHPALAAAAAAGPPSQFSPGHLAHPELLQRYPHHYIGAGTGQQHPLLDPMLDPRLAAVMMERNRIEEEKAREAKESERSREERTKVSAHVGISGREREPGERERTRQPSYESHITETSVAQDLARNKPGEGQRDSMRAQSHMPHLNKSPFSDTKMSSSEHALRANRGHESSMDTHVQQPSRDPYSKHETSRNSLTNTFKPKISPNHPYTHVIKPYDRVMDQQLSLANSSVTVRHHDQDSPCDRHGRLLPDGVVSPSHDKHKAQMLSPTIQRPWSSVPSTSSSSHQNHHYHHHHVDHRQQSPVSKERSSSDFFRPFDDHVGKKENNVSSLRSTPEEYRGEKDKKSNRNSSISSLPPSRHSQTNSSSSHGPHSSSFSANILSIPSVKVHPQHWLPANTQQKDIFPQGLAFPKPLSSPSSSTMLPSTSSASLPAPGGPPPLLPSLQVAGVVSEITAAGDMPPANPFMPTISSCITDRIERFDFKSLARECTASVPNFTRELNPSVDSAASKHSVSKLDRRAAALHQQKRNQRLGLDADFTSSFISSGEECGDEEDERMMARLTMISRASPIPLNTDPNKLELLEYLGLTTHKGKKEMEVRKERQRRHKLRMTSLSPVRQNIDRTPAFDPSPVSLSPLTAALDAEHSPPGKEQRQHVDAQSHGKKSNFLAVLGLKLLSRAKKTELMRQRKVRSKLTRKNGFGLLKSKKNAFKKSVKAHRTDPSPPSAAQNTNFNQQNQQQQSLINAGLATEVRSLHSVQTKQLAKEEIVSWDVKDRLDKLSVPHEMAGTSSQLGHPPYSLGPGPSIIHSHHSLSSNIGLEPASFESKSSQAFLGHREFPQAADSLATHPQPALSAGHSGLQPHPHLYSRGPDLPTTTGSGQSQLSNSGQDMDR